MKDSYIVLDSEYIEILIPERFVEFGNRVLDFSTKKVKEYLDFFKEDSYGTKIKASYFVKREDFLQRIKDIKSPGDNMPPSWATGCFYGGETQILMDEDDIEFSFYTLIHEIFHLMFGKFVYNKNKVNRVIWLDEALAGNFDTTTERLIENGRFKQLIDKYYHCDCLPTMENFDFSDGVFTTEEYNGYELFKIIGRYLIEKYNKDELLEYVNDYDKVIKDSKNILRDSLEYFYKK